MGDDVGVPLMRTRGLTALERISMLRNLAPLRKGRRPRYSFARGNSEPKRLGAGSRATTHGPRPTGHDPRATTHGPRAEDMAARPAGTVCAVRLAHGC